VEAIRKVITEHEQTMPGAPVPGFTCI
jgi:hypothetical protein